MAAAPVKLSEPKQQPFHRNFNAPSWGELFHAFYLSPGSVPNTGWTFQPKSIPAIRLIDLQSLSYECPPELQLAYDEDVKWLTDLLNYAEMPEGEWDRRPPVTCRLSNDENEFLLEIGFSVPFIGRPCGFVRTFKCPEPIKERFRWINHTVSVNDWLRSVGLGLPTANQIRGSLFQGSWAVCYDMAQFFHQFEYSPSLRKYFVYEHGGVMYSLTRMAMGQKQTSRIAHTSLSVISYRASQLSFGLRYIDNLLFVGSPDSVWASSKQLFHDANFVGATINEAMDFSRVSRKVEFLGFVLDYEHKTVALGDKTIKKLMFVRDEINNAKQLTTRQLSVVLALLFYAHYVKKYTAGDSISLHPTAVRLYSNIGKRCSGNPSLYDEVWPITDNERRDILSWLDSDLLNIPAMVLADTHNPNDILFVDSCCTRWWAIRYNRITREVRRDGGDFPEALPSSVASEPTGATYALERLYGPDERLTVLVVTDHESMVPALEKGYSLHPLYNQMCRYVRLQRPKLVLRGIHLAGVDHPCDEESRGSDFIEEKLWKAVASVEGCLPMKEQHNGVEVPVVFGKPAFGQENLEAVVGPSPI